MRTVTETRLRFTGGSRYLDVNDWTDHPDPETYEPHTDGARWVNRARVQLGAMKQRMELLALGYLRVHRYYQEAFDVDGRGLGPEQTGEIARAGGHPGQRLVTTRIETLSNQGQDAVAIDTRQTRYIGNPRPVAGVVPEPPEACAPYLWVGVRGLSYAKASGTGPDSGGPDEEPPWLFITVFEPPMTPPASGPADRPYVLGHYPLYTDEPGPPNPNVFPNTPAGGFRSDPPTFDQVRVGPGAFSLPPGAGPNPDYPDLETWFCDTARPGPGCYYSPFMYPFALHTPRNMYMLFGGFAWDPYGTGANNQWENVAVLDPGDPVKQFDATLPIRWAGYQDVPSFQMAAAGPEWSLRGTVRGGEYAIKVQAMNFNECAEEQITGEIEVRVGRGAGAVTLRRLFVIEAASNWYRDLAPYGYYVTGETLPEFGVNSHGTNWWQGAILADVANCRARFEDYFVPSGPGYAMPEAGHLPFDPGAELTPNLACGCVNVLSPFPETETPKFTPWGFIDGTPRFGTTRHVGGRLAKVVSTYSGGGVCQVQVITTCPNAADPMVLEKDTVSGHLITRLVTGGVPLGTGEVWLASNKSNHTSVYSLGQTVAITHINLSGGPTIVVGVMPLDDPDIGSFFADETFANANLLCHGTDALKDVYNDYELLGWVFDKVEIAGRDWYRPVTDPAGNPV